MAALNWYFLITNAASFFSFQATSVVERLAQNPYWSALKAHLPQKCFLSHSEIVCSKVFPTISSMQSARFEVRSPTGLPGFCSSTSQTTFHRVGNSLLFKAKSKTASSIPGLARCMLVHKLLDIPAGLVTYSVNCRIDFCCCQQRWLFLGFSGCDYQCWELRE